MITQKVAICKIPTGTEHKSSYKITKGQAEIKILCAHSTTEHNWAELVYTAMGHADKFPSKPNHFALLAVREARVVPNDPKKKLTQHEWLDQKTTVRRTTRGTDTRFYPHGNSGAQAPADEASKWATYNDVLYVVGLKKEEANSKQYCHKFSCTVDTSYPKNKRGIPIQLEGHLYEGYPHLHATDSKYYKILEDPVANALRFRNWGNKKPKAKKRLTDQQAKKKTANQKPKLRRGGGQITIARSAIQSKNKSRINYGAASILDSVEDAKVYIGGDPWRFCRQETENIGINLHMGSRLQGYKSEKTAQRKKKTLAPNLVGTWSAGCTVLAASWIPGAKKYADGYANLIKLLAKANNSNKLPYLVVSSQYVRLFDEWVEHLNTMTSPDGKTLTDEQRVEESKSANHVILREALRQPSNTSIQQSASRADKSKISETEPDDSRQTPMAQTMTAKSTTTERYLPSFIADSFVTSMQSTINLIKTNKLKLSKYAQQGHLLASNLEASLDSCCFSIKWDQTVDYEKQP